MPRAVAVSVMVAAMMTAAVGVRLPALYARHARGGDGDFGRPSRGGVRDVHAFGREHADADAACRVPTPAAARAAVGSPPPVPRPNGSAPPPLDAMASVAATSVTTPPRTMPTPQCYSITLQRDGCWSSVHVLRGESADRSMDIAKGCPCAAIGADCRGSRVATSAAPTGRGAPLFRRCKSGELPHPIGQFRSRWRSARQSSALSRESSAALHHATPQPSLRCPRRAKRQMCEAAHQFRSA